MTLSLRRSGRVALPVLAVLGLMGAVLGVRFFAQAAPPPGASIADTAPPTDAPEQPIFLLGAIPGLTTTSHLAPPVTSVPLGTVLELFQFAPPDATVTWTGADEVLRTDEGSTAVCPLFETGTFVVEVELVPAGGQPLVSQAKFNSVNTSVSEISVSPMQVVLEELEIDESLPQDELNEVTMDYFFGPSIAAVRDLGAGQYLTSVERPVQMRVAVDPPGFAPLMEWRIDGVALGQHGFWAPETDGMGLTETVSVSVIGNHIVEVGPVLDPAEVNLEAYKAILISHDPGEIIPEGEPVVFEAATDPPGYEDEITWLSSTKYGTGEPVLGAGPVFIAEFNDTWGPLPSNPDLEWQWLGVKADNKVLNQDQKLCPFDGDDVLSLICEFLQDTDCVDAQTNQICRATMIVFDNELSPLAVRCDCVDPGTCGLVLEPDRLSCQGACPQGLTCTLLENGEAIGSNIPMSDIQPGALYSCDCQ